MVFPITIEKLLEKLNISTSYKRVNSPNNKKEIKNSKNEVGKMVNIQMDYATFNLTSIPEKEKQQNLPEETVGQQIIIGSPLSGLYNPEFSDIPTEKDIINKVF